MLSGSGFANGLSWLSYFRVLQLGEASKVVPIDKLSAVFALVVAALFLGETLTWKTGLGGALNAAVPVILSFM